MSNHEKILIADDYLDFLEGLSYVLKDHYEVTTAGNLTEAKNKVSTTVFDVISKDADASGHFVSKWKQAATAVTARSFAGQAGRRE